MSNTPKKRGGKKTATKEVDMEQKTEEMRKKLLFDANNLLDFITIEMTVGSQMDCTKKKIKELTEKCKEEYEIISKLDEDIHREEQEAEAIDAGEIPKQDEGNDIDHIVQLEEELKRLYAEKAKLMKKQRA